MDPTTLQLSKPFGHVAYKASGQGEPLVLIHGVGMQCAAWDPQMAALSATHHVIAVDIPGHGGSDPLSADALLPDFVAWLHAVLQSFDLGPVNIAGHSMGALIAGGYALEHPQATRRVALLNAVHCRTPHARSAVEQRAVNIAQGQMDFQAPLTRWFGDSPIEKEARALVTGWLSDMDISSYATAYHAFATGDRIYADRWSAVSCPMLALTGDADLNSTPWMSKNMARAAQNGTVKILSGHRHMINLTAPDEVNTILLDWLARPEHLKEEA